MRYQNALVAYLVIMLAVLSLSACSRGGESDGGVARIDESQRLALQAKADSRSEVEVEATVTKTAEQETNSQNAVASDDRSDEEILTGFATCMREQGFTIPDPELNADGTVNFQKMRETIFQDPKFDPSSTKLRESLRECGPLLRDATFAQQRQTEDPIELQDNLLAFAQCLRDEGFDVPDPDFSQGPRQAMRPLIQSMQGSDSKIQEAVLSCRETVFGNDDTRPPGGGGMRGRPGGGNTN